MWQEVRVETSRTVLEVLRLRLAPGIQLLAITMRISGNIIVVNRDALARSDYLLYGSSGASGIETNLLATDHEIANIRTSTAVAASAAGGECLPSHAIS